MHLLDVRQHGEWRSGHVPGALHVELGLLAGAEVASRSLAIMCAHGQRAMTAASILARRGNIDGLPVLTDGADAWIRLTDAALATE
ncbi:MAG: rhodanese-like domain-containing protein [Deltaproteobacteria bacterium]